MPLDKLLLSSTPWPTHIHTCTQCIVYTVACDEGVKQLYQCLDMVCSLLKGMCGNQSFLVGTFWVTAYTPHTWSAFLLVCMLHAWVGSHCPLSVKECIPAEERATGKQCDSIESPIVLPASLKGKKCWKKAPTFQGFSHTHSHATNTELFHACDSLRAASTLHWFAVVSSRLILPCIARWLILSTVTRISIWWQVLKQVPRLSTNTDQ